MKTVKVTAFDFSHDVNGNPTAHYIRDDTQEQTKRRRQIGYNDRMEGAQLMWKDIYNAKLISTTGSREEGEIVGTFEIKESAQ